VFSLDSNRFLLSTKSKDKFINLEITKGVLVGGDIKGLFKFVNSSLNFGASLDIVLNIIKPTRLKLALINIKDEKAALIQKLII
jgi:hypothetical protein